LLTFEECLAEADDDDNDDDDDDRDEELWQADGKSRKARCKDDNRGFFPPPPLDEAEKLAENPPEFLVRSLSSFGLRLPLCGEEGKEDDGGKEDGNFDRKEVCGPQASSLNTPAKDRRWLASRV